MNALSPHRVVPSCARLESGRWVVLSAPGEPGGWGLPLLWTGFTWATDDRFAREFRSQADATAYIETRYDELQAALDHGSEALRVVSVAVD